MVQCSIRSLQLPYGARCITLFATLCTFNDFLSCHSFKHIICRFVSAGCTDDQYNACSMLSECLRVRDGLLKLPDCFSQSDINDIIQKTTGYHTVNGDLHCFTHRKQRK